MKINLLLASDNVRAGYRNIDPYGEFVNKDQTFSATKESGDVFALDWLVDDGEAIDLVALDVLDFVPVNEKEAVIDRWLRKLAFGGRIVIGGNDLHEASKSLFLDRLDLHQVLHFLYGDPTFPFGNRKACLDLTTMVKLLKARGLHIIEKKLVHYTYCVVAERPSL